MEINEDDWVLPEEFSYEDRRKQNKIFLKNIPVGFTDEGLIQMCEQYGKIKEFNRPNCASFAFVTYESFAEADTIIRRFAEDNQSLPIQVEHARKKEPIKNRDDFEVLETPIQINQENIPMQNMLELSKRKIQGPFASPTEINRESLIQGKHYRNIMLKAVDKSKFYHWDSNIEAHVDYESENGYKIVHGRAILKSISVTPTNVDESTSLKRFVYKSDSIDYGILQCANCSYASDKKCKQCMKNYCTLDCHAIDTRATERDTAVPSKQASIFGFTIETEPIQRMVKLTAVINHRMVFVRPAETNQETAFAKLLNDTVKYAKNAANYKIMPEIGSLVLAKYDYYQRALVLRHINDIEVAIAFIDFGNVEIRKYTELKIMPSDLKKRKRFATRIHLSKIKEDLMNEKALKYLYNLMMHDIELKINDEVIDGNIFYELKAPDSWVNQMVNDLNTDEILVPLIKDMSYRIFSTVTPNRIEKSIEHKEMSGKELIILDNSKIVIKCLSFLAVDDLNEFLQNERRIQNICNYLFTLDKCYTPRFEEYCVVRYKGHWFRAECIEICHDGFATMQFIDYGMLQLIEVNDIRPIPDALVFESLTMTDIDCFADHDEITFEKSLELANVYQIQSRHRIQRMELRMEKNKYGENTPTVYAWLEKYPK